MGARKRVGLYCSDVSSAFDRVNAERLVQKLRARGVHERIGDRELAGRAHGTRLRGWSSITAFCVAQHGVSGYGLGSQFMEHVLFRRKQGS